MAALHSDHNRQVPLYKELDGGLGSVRLGLGCSAHASTNSYHTCHYKSAGCTYIQDFTHVVYAHVPNPTMQMRLAHAHAWHSTQSCVHIIILGNAMSYASIWQLLDKGVLRLTMNFTYHFSCTPKEILHIAIHDPKATYKNSTC